MNHKFIAAAACAAMLASAQGIQAQNLMEGDGVSIHALGANKSWTNGNGDTFTFNPETLEPALNPENMANIYLFPEGGYDTEANRETGIQGFYVDLGASKAIGLINTTWEGAAADAYDIYLTDTTPTDAILSTTPTYSASGLGQYTQNSAILPDGSKGRYVVFQPTNATNYGWGVKIRSIAAYPALADELTFFSIEPAFIFDPESELSFTFRNQFGAAIDPSEVTVTCDHASYADGKLTLKEGDTAIFTASIDGNDALTFTVSHPTAPDNAKNYTKGIYTKQDPNVLWQSGYNNPGGEEPTLNKGEHEFENGELATLFHAAYCIFFYNDQTMSQYGAWNTIDCPDPATALGKYLHLQVYSSRPAECAISFNDNTPDQFHFSLLHDSWQELIVDMAEVDNMRNMSIRFPEQHDLDCVLLSNIYFTDVKTGVEGVEVEDADALVNVYNVSGVLVKSNVAKADALEGLAKGLYIVGGKKVVK